MTSEDKDLLNRRKRKFDEEEEVNTKEDKVCTKVKEERGPAREFSASAVSTQAAAAGLSLLSDGDSYNRFVHSQSK
jgi:hypothetical protein